MYSTAAHRVTSLLHDKAVTYTPISALSASDIPSSCLKNWGVTYPGSASDLPSRQFLTLENNRATLTVCSRQLEFPRNEGRKVLFQLLDFNTSETQCFWVLEEREERCFPYARMTLILSANEVHAKQQIWLACGLIDRLFREGSRRLRTAQSLTPLEIGRMVKSIFAMKGFTKIKETQIPYGHSVLVIAANELESESSTTKRFPIKVDVTGILAFRIYFSIRDAAVTATEPFRTAVKQLLPQLNWILPVGYYNYSTQSNQIQLTLKLHYKLLSIEDLETSIQAYYDCVISGYNDTVKAIASLYEQSKRENVEHVDVYSHMAFVGEETRGDFYLEKSSLGLEEQFELKKELKVLLANRDLVAFFLPNPCYFCEVSSAFYFKTSQNLSRFAEFVTNSFSLRSLLYSKILALFMQLRPVGLFPELENVYVSNDFSLVILPNRRFHTDSTRFLRECFELFEMIGSGEGGKGNSEYFLQFATFSDFTIEETGNNSQVLRAEIGSEAYFLHTLSDMNRDFSTLLAAYRSRLSTLRDQKNSLIGWTQRDESVLIPKDVKSRLYICERAKLGLWTCQNPLQECYQLLLLLEELHNSGNFHLFLSFGSIRKDPASSRLALILPCLDLVFADLLDSFLCQQWAEFQAPEVQAYLAFQTPIQNPYCADIYSLCKVVSITMRNYWETGSNGLQAILQQGLSVSPQIRPKLYTIKAAFEKVLTLPIAPSRKSPFQKPFLLVSDGIGEP